MYFCRELSRRLIVFFLVMFFFTPNSFSSDERVRKFINGTKYYVALSNTYPTEDTRYTSPDCEGPIEVIGDRTFVYFIRKIGGDCKCRVSKSSSQISIGDGVCRLGLDEHSSFKMYRK